MARPKVTVKILRAEIVRKKLEALPDNVAARIHRALANAGDDIVKTAKQLVPVDEGVLRDSITWAWGDAAYKRKDGRATAGMGTGAIVRGQNYPAFKITVGADADFLRQHKRPLTLPRWVEFGTQPTRKGEKIVNRNARGRVFRVRKAAGFHAGSPPRPFLFPAYRVHQKTIKHRLRLAVNTALADTAKGNGNGR